jgi:protoheme IX farnesyltransferase
MATSDTFRAYWRLGKPGIVRMVVVTSALSYALAARGMPMDWLRFWAAMLGIGLGAAGAAVLNNFLERDLDAVMERTRGRELPAQRIEPASALVYGVVLTLLGLAVLLLAGPNLLPAFLVLLTSFLYVVVYTPLKRRTWLNTSIGAIPGALPVLCGWAAAVGRLDFTAWVLFALLFAWQHPHFYAIAWLYREDYRRAGFKMLSVVDARGYRLFLQVILYAFLLLAISLLPKVLGTAGWIYFAGALALGLWCVADSLRFVRNASPATARRLLRGTIFYLPLLALTVSADVLWRF